ncbi:serine acetyltransferase [Thalassotalea sp. LPB0316]|uniref:serine O-acetyltransferase n=1 Tax=Thalassotalea sp. LPB0316 TaxID=2769490 RepID=UPI001866A7F3|nr:serine acetyltransferase [Thalassotalea sp. LPB0316]QOL26502.1 serine acetyltransferase [Thalassotalea sp. LPB0316]
MKITKDLSRKQEIYNNDGANASMLKVFLTDGTLANVLYRLASFFSRFKILFPLAFLSQWLNKLLHGCVIGVNSKFDDGFVLAHPIGVVINSKVVGGKNITLESSVVIGDEKGKSPTLGDNIFIGAGAKIIGGIKVGNNVNIGANAVVVKDVPDNVTVVGIPARIIKKDS